MNIVTVIAQFPPYITSGLGRYAEALHPHLVDGHRHWVCSINPGDLPRVERRAGVTVLRPVGPLLRRLLRGGDLNRTRRRDFLTLALNMVVSNLRYVGLIRRLARRQRIDVVAVHDPTNFLAALLCRRLVRAPLVFHLHTTEYALAPTSSISDPLHLFGAIERAVLRAAAQVVVASPETRDLLVAAGCAPGKLAVVPLGNPLPAATPRGGTGSGVAARAALLRRDLGVPADGKVLLFVGRLEVQKGIYPLLDALVRVVAADPRVHLVMVGAGDRDGVRTRARAAGIGRHVIVTDGFVATDDLLPYYALADACIFPSLYEPFGLVALEAMAFAKPVILGDGFSRMFAGDAAEPAARYVRSDDPADIAQTVVEVLASPDLRAALGASGFRLQQRFTWRRTAAQTLAIYEAVTGVRDPDHLPASG